MTTQTGGLTILDEASCRSLLTSQYVGRLGYILDSRPVIVPVNYRLARAGDIFVFSRPGEKLQAARGGSALCLQIDGTDDVRHSGWSVLVYGSAVVIEGPEARSIAARECLRPWPQPDHRMALIRLTPEDFQGRKLR